MRLLSSLTYYTPYNSGLTLYVKRLSETLVKKGYQVIVLTMNFDKKCRSAEVVNGVKIVRADYLAKISKGFLSFDWLVKSWQETKNADVVFVNLPQFEGAVPAFFGRLFGKKVISVYLCEVDLPDGILNTVIEWLLHLSHVITLSISNKVITHTKDFADNSKLLPHFKSKLSFIYPPLLVPNVNKRVQKIFMDKIDFKGHFVIGVAARLAAEKGIEYLLEAIPAINSKLKNQDGGGDGIKIVIAGPLEPAGERAYKEKILRLVKKYKDYVVFLGELKEEEMGAFYPLIDLLVLPSINSTEAFGMVQVEAMLMGVPCVSSDLPGVRIPIQKTGMGLIVPIKDSQKLAEAIVKILLNKEKYMKDKKLVEKEFSFKKTIDFYQKLLRTAISKS